MKKTDSILILGSGGLVGSALHRELKHEGYSQLLTPRSAELDLRKQTQTLEYFAKHRPKYVFMAAAKVGGIHANNTYRADFIFQNLAMETHVFEAAFEFKAEKLLFLGSSCIYPKESPQPIKEEYLLTGPLEATNEPYAIAKIAGLKMAENFRRQYGCRFFSAMPTNLYGENDNFHLENSHVIPGMIARMKLAIEKGEKTFEVWGSGNPRREFLHVSDMAKACILLMTLEKEIPDLINIGSGVDISIADLAQLIKKLMDYQGEIVFDQSKPDGTMRKLMDNSRLQKLGWKPEISLEDGLKQTIQFYLNR
jgi:GDP-L-fucose synthase